MADRLALIIANGDFDDPRLSRLETPTRDAEALAEVLKAQAIGGFDDVTLMLDQPEGVVRRSIGRFYRRRRRSDLLLLYYSGHGVRDEHGDLYLAARDTEMDIASASALSVSFLREQIDKSGAQRKVVVLDCCYSGAFAKSGLGDSVRTEDAFAGSGYGRVILTATDALGLSWEGDEWLGEGKPSVFTHFLVKGLRTGAADLNRDGKISVDELYNYVHEQVLTSGHAKQTPHMSAQEVAGQIVIARNPRMGMTTDVVLDDVRQQSEAITSADGESAWSPSAAKPICYLTKDELAWVAGYTMNGVISAVDWAPRSPILAVASSSLITIFLCDTQIQRSVASIEAGAYVNSLAFSPGGGSLAAGLSDNTVRIWKWADGELIATFQGHTRAVNTIAFSSDGAYLVSGSRDSTVRMWQLESGRALLDLRDHSWHVYSVAVAPSGEMLASAGADSTIRLWRVADGQLQHTLEHAKAVYSIDFSPDERLLAGGTGNSIAIWQVGTDVRVALLEEHSNVVNDVAFSPDGWTLASGGNDKTLRLWRVSEGECF